MKRLILSLALVAPACVQPGSKSDLSVEDPDSPQILSTVPPVPDGGLFTVSSPVEITFSEPMDPNSLRPGIAIFTGNPAQELPLAIAVPQPSPVPDYAQTNPGPYTVQVRPAAGTPCSATVDAGFCFAPGTYLLQLRTLLTDPAGNPIPSAQQVLFTAQ